MTEAELLQLDFTAAYIWQGLQRNDRELVRVLVDSVPYGDLDKVRSYIDTQINSALATPCLDVIFKQRLKDMRWYIARLVNQAQMQGFYVAQACQAREGSYAHYSAMCASLGKDPLNYYEWIECKESSDSTQ